MSTSPVRRARRLLARVGRTSLRRVLGPASPARRVLPAPVKERLRSLRRRLPTRVVRYVDASVAPSAKNAPVPASLDAGVLTAASVRPEPPAEATRVWVAPANFAGQGKAWAESLNRHVEGVGARSMAVRGVISFDTDQEVANEAYRDVGWQKDQERYVFENYTHALIEAGRPLFGTRYGTTCEVEIRRLREAGLRVGLISHGSDLRIPSRHAQLFLHSPFDDPDDKTTRILEARAINNARIIEEFDGPVFVSTPDLLDYAPRATWCPTVVNLAEWSDDWPLLERAVPRVVHIPSNGRLKGSEFIDEVCQALGDEGVIEYRRPRDVSREDIKREFAEADIVIDQLVMGLYGVTAIEALACGRVVVAFLGDAVRERVRQAVGTDVPIVEATVETLEQVLRGLVADRDGSRAVAEQGPAYVSRVHDGRMSAAVLTRFTGGEAASLEAAPGTVERTVRPAPASDAPVRLFVGPANFGGQGHAWARAAEAHLSGVSARSMAARQPTLRFATDYEVDASVFGDEAWGERQVRYLAEFYTHVLVESMRPVTGHRRGVHATDETETLRAAGLELAYIAHGTDVRIPSVHRETTSWSPFDQSWDAIPDVAELERRARRNAEAMAAFDGPTFVSTPDLLTYVPDARWCPVVVDVDRWAKAAETTPRGGGVPVVVHAPSHDRLKGSGRIEPIAQALAEAGVLHYRRLGGIAPPDMPEHYAQADIVLDQFVLGSYGVTACEAMAAGRAVVGHVTAEVRERVATETGMELPIVEATPDHLSGVLRDLAADTDRRRVLGEAGQRFVRAVHDGRVSARVLGRWLRPDLG